MALAAPGMALATNGYFSHGYGMKSKGMAGVGIALPQDAMAAATNPAGMAFVGDRLDVGVDWFRPIRDTEIVSPFGVIPGLTGDFSGNGKKNFLVPEFGYNKMLGWNMALGVNVYGNGGMNTTYDNGPAPFGGGRYPTIQWGHRAENRRKPGATVHCADLRLQDQQEPCRRGIPESRLSAFPGRWSGRLRTLLDVPDQFFRQGG